MPEPIPFPTPCYRPDDRLELTPKALAYLESQGLHPGA
jgi:hypothetical protein